MYGGEGGIRTHGPDCSGHALSRRACSATPAPLPNSKIVYLMAERVGFEPTIPRRDTAFRERRLKPLGHLSIIRNCI